MPQLFAPFGRPGDDFFLHLCGGGFRHGPAQKLPNDHVSEDSKDEIKLVMGLIATMAALILGLRIASANSSYAKRRAGGTIRQTPALMLERINRSIPWPFLTVLVFWISMLFVGFGLFARANATVIVALLIGALSVSSAIFHSSSIL